MGPFRGAAERVGRGRSGGRSGDGLRTGRRRGLGSCSFGTSFFAGFSLLIGLCAECGNHAQYRCLKNLNDLSDRFVDGDRNETLLR